MSFNQIDRRRSEASPARVSPVQAGTQEASPTTRVSSRYVFRFRLFGLLRPVKRPDGSEAVRKNGTRRVAARWSSSEELQVELTRSRRYGHSFALVRIPCKHGPEGGWNWRREISSAVASLLRSVDRVWSEGTNVYLLLPECNRTMAEAMLARIREPLSKLLTEEERAGVSSAVFPDDGVTSGALFSALHGRSVRPATRQENVAVLRAPETPVA